jgi:hypothetical protein
MTQADQAAAIDIPENPVPLSVKAGFINDALLTDEQANEIDGTWIWYTGAQKFTETIVDYDKRYNQDNDRKPYEMRQFGVTVRELFFIGDSLVPVVRILVEGKTRRPTISSIRAFERWAHGKQIWLQRVGIVPDIATYDPNDLSSSGIAHVEYIIRDYKKDIAQREQ